MNEISIGKQQAAGCILISDITEEIWQQVLTISNILIYTCICIYIYIYVYIYIIYVYIYIYI